MSVEPEAPPRPRVRMLCAVNYRLPPHDYRIHYASLSAACDVEFALPEKPDAPVPWHRLELREGVRARDLVALVGLARLLLRMRSAPTVAHFFSTKLVLAGPLLARLAGLRCIVTVTGFGRTFSDTRARYRLLQGPYRALFRLAVSLADLVLFQNRGDLDDMRRAHPTLAGKFRYVGSATAATGTGRPKPSPPPLRVVHVGRLLRSKGILDYIEVARALSGDRFRFTLAGPASASEPGTARAVEDAAGAGIIHYMGPLSSSELNELYGAAHVAVFLSHAEGMARVLLEAGMHGLFPIAYDIPANRDLIGPGRGLLVPLGAVDEVAAHLTDLADDASRREREADAFASFVGQEFGVAAYTRRLDELVSEAVAGSGAP